MVATERMDTLTTEAPGWRRDRLRPAARLLGIRALIAVPVTLAVSAGMFGVAALSPLDPLAAYLGDNYQFATQSQREAMRAAYDLDQPWWEAWWHWLTAALQGDLGWSSTQSLPVSTVLAERMPFTLGLSGTALLLGAVIALVLGCVAGMRGGIVDRLCNSFAVAFAAVPPFVMSLALVTVFAVGLRWFPTSGARPPGGDYTGAGLLTYSVLPLSALVVSQIPWLLLATRAAVLEARDSDAVRAARARGVHGWPLLRAHIAPVSVLPTLALTGTRLPELIAGAAIVETVFGWPGVAAVLVDSAVALDFSLSAALTVGAALAVLLGSAFSDAAAVALDPRIGLRA
ncbi:ABC transporter permease [Mycolicibacterium goodii]|nr:ABC transporter permease [Mycolicibacterium goodii]MBU8815589.1 ABC transporter permease [Mycolicibacterium goodii]